MNKSIREYIAQMERLKVAAEQDGDEADAEELDDEIEAAQIIRRVLGDP